MCLTELTKGEMNNLNARWPTLLLLAVTGGKGLGSVAVKAFVNYTVLLLRDMFSFFLRKSWQRAIQCVS